MRKDVTERTAPRPAAVRMEGDVTESKEDVCVCLVGQESSVSQVTS